MTKEEYRTRMSEIYNQIGDLAAERDKMIVERMTLIREDLEAIGLVQDMEVIAIVATPKAKYDRKCTFNGVRCNSQRLIYLEFVYQNYDDHVVHPDMLDVNDDITILMPNGIGFDYHPFMSKYQ